MAVVGGEVGGALLSKSLKLFSSFSKLGFEKET